MRIISGKARNMRIECPEGLEVRPMLERVREAVFNIFRDVTPGQNVLDLYAGCGSLGIEALSRGAEWCVFVERDRRARLILEQNLAHTRLAEFCDVIEGDVFRSVPRLKRIGRTYRLVMVDPPYKTWEDPGGRTTILSFLDTLEEEGLLGERPWLVVHHSPKVPAVERTRHLMLDEARRYGRSMISIYRRLTEEELKGEGGGPVAEDFESAEAPEESDNVEAPEE